ncbi:MAG: hypothetical protein MPK31_09040 [Gammaproteobacteria bacterium]|nr:hypothetical protein [Gammaproteobacteria bacterium]MDA8009690.1 hypothetical protein [Alphaproteobacteria bacterium]
MNKIRTALLAAALATTTTGYAAGEVFRPQASTDNYFEVKQVDGLPFNPHAGMRVVRKFLATIPRACFFTEDGSWRKGVKRGWNTPKRIAYVHFKDTGDECSWWLR